MTLTTSTVVSLDTPASNTLAADVEATVQAAKIPPPTSPQSIVEAGNSPQAAQPSTGTTKPIPASILSLTSIFDPPAACFTQVYGYASGPLSIFPQDYQSQTTSSCYPRQYATWFSPGICPNGFQWVGLTVATGIVDVSNTPKTTRATCCPS
jgi:hypothetical protein